MAIIEIIAIFIWIRTLFTGNQAFSSESLQLLITGLHSGHIKDTFPGFSQSVNGLTSGIVIVKISGNRLVILHPREKS